jgi:D-3-phosphoglycerate dehydrogenase
MYNVLKLNKISPVIDDIFDSNYNASETVVNPDGIILRSFNMAEYAVEDNLVAIGRAGAGVNNIPIEIMRDKGIVVFNTPGANANAVKELVICGMLLASRDIIGGNKWVNTLTENVAKATEKGKSNFGGTEIFGKKLGIIGLGAIGILVANACIALGMKVIGYDPYLSEDNKKKLDKKVEVVDLDTIFTDSDMITIHVPLLDSTKNLVNKDSIAKMKKGVVILNMARGGLVCVEDLKAGIADGKISKYVIDFPSEDVLNSDNIIVLPHLGASTEEAEDNCAIMAANQLKEYLENGNIINSVNFPNLTKEWTKKFRTCVLYKEGCSVIEALKGDIKFACKKGFGYAIIDTDEAFVSPSCAYIIKTRTLSK